MKKLFVLVAALMFALTASAVEPSNANAWFAGAGSSAQFFVLALGASSSVNHLCGPYYYYQKNGGTVTAGGHAAIDLVDPRNSSIAPEPGNIWIIWNNDAQTGGPNPNVCFYVSVDSIVGVREYFASATVSLSSNMAGDAGLSIPYEDYAVQTALPTAVLNLVNGSVLNFAATDIRPEDAEFASNRVLTSRGAFMTGRGWTGLGYQGLAATPWLGQPIYSSVSSGVANPVAYNFIPGDTDPITLAATRPYQEIEIGAAPVLVIANYQDNVAGSGGLGDPNLNITDIGRRTLADVLTGNIFRPRELSTTSSASTSPAVGLKVWIREPLSGTYNTNEFNIVDTNDINGDYGQGAGRVTGTEANINPANPSPCLGLQTAAGCPLADTPSANPYFVNGPVAGSSRGRVIGTGDMVNAVYNNADSIGYAFWSFSSFNGKQGHVKYLTVNGVDPLFSTFNTNPGGTGALPQCPSTPCVLPLDNIKNGAYPIWSKYRAVWNPYDSASVVTNVVANAQTVSTSLLSDLVPATALNVFRSHFGQVASTHGTGYTGNNGFKAGIPETGGDMGGQVLTVQSELDVLVDTGGAQQINEKW